MAGGAGLLLVLALVGILLVRGGFSRGTQPRGGSIPSGNSNDLGGPATGEARGSNAEGSGTLFAPELRVYLITQKRLNEVVRRVMQVLTGATDSASARAAAPQLTELLPDLESAMQQATAALVVVDQSPIAKQQLTRVMIQQTQADSDFARQVFAELGGEEQLNEIPDLPGVMDRVARNPEAAPVHEALRSLRDLLLRGRAPLAPLLLRRQLEKELGAAGSALQPR